MVISFCGGGENNKCIGNYSTAMGYNTSADYSSTAMGYLTNANGGYSTAMGSNTKASGAFSTAMGYLTNANGGYSTAMGASTNASGFFSTAMGCYTKASGWYSTAIGYSSVAQSSYSSVFGRFNVISGSSYDSWNLTDPLFVVGNGMKENSPHNALTILKNGAMNVASKITQNADIRLKEDIEPLSSMSLKKQLNNIHPIYFKWKNKSIYGDERQIGILAHEVREFFPELVMNDSSGYLSVDYSRLSILLLEGMKEMYINTENMENLLNNNMKKMEDKEKGLKDKNKELEDKMKKMEDKNKELNDKNKELEDKMKKMEDNDNELKDKDKELEDKFIYLEAEMKKYIRMKS